MVSTDLRKLYLFESRIVPPPDPGPAIFNLPQLQLLHLKAVICTSSTLEELLSPTSLPALEILDFFSVHQTYAPSFQHQPPQPLAAQLPPNLQQLNSMFAQLQTPSPSASTQFHLPPYLLTPEIEHLALGPYSTRTLPLSALPLFASLVSLSIPIGLFLSSSLESSHFPSSLRALRITSAMTRSDEREQGRSQVDMMKRWETALVKAVQVLKTVRGGQGPGWGMRQMSSDEIDPSSSMQMEEPTISDEIEVVTSLSVRIIQEEENLGNFSGRLALPNRSSGYRLSYEWGTNGAESSSRDGGLELGQERWRETL
ncbi:hypothetical protein JCM3765_007449 [Sporobolomyces pararoseus]